MNPRDEKILLIIQKKQCFDYDYLVPFSVIQRALSWIDGTELSLDLLKLVENQYLFSVENPVSKAGWWYGLTPLGNRECERIQYDNTEKKKNRNIQIACSIISVILGFFWVNSFKILTLQFSDNGK